MKFPLFSILILLFCIFSLLQTKKHHQDYDSSRDLSSPSSGKNFLNFPKNKKKIFFFLFQIFSFLLFLSENGYGTTAPASAPDMPDEEPKILAMEEERLQNTFLKNQHASFSHEVDRRLPNGAA